MGELTITVTVTDSEAGTSESREMPASDYFILCTGDCYVSATQVYPKSGTHILTIKGRRDS